MDIQAEVLNLVKSEVVVALKHSGAGGNMGLFGQEFTSDNSLFQRIEYAKFTRKYDELIEELSATELLAIYEAFVVARVTLGQSKSRLGILGD